MIFTRVSWAISTLGRLRFERLDVSNHFKPSQHFMDKAGYRATGCGRVGRGGYVCFPTFRLDHLYELTGQPTDQPINRPTNGWMEKASY